MDSRTEALRKALDADLKEARTAREVEAVRVKYLGQRGGLITRLIKDTDFQSLSQGERRAVGVGVQELKSFAQGRIEKALLDASMAGSLEASYPRVDLTLPGVSPGLGSITPIATLQVFLEDIFRGLGFLVEQGYEVETEYYNFDVLNIPPEHPARDMQDTFWLDNGMLLRTHTSASQVRVMRKYGSPLRAIFPGRCFRFESTDASHENSFYQCEGLMVNRGVTVASLIGVMEMLLTQVFEQLVTVRLRPGYFPFVEPGFELDIRCLLCGGQGCRVCKRSGWVELMPCGMVHPRVLAAGGMDAEQSGFAFGLGLTRLAMMKFGIPDIRLFDSGDLRFYRQFPAAV